MMEEVLDHFSPVERKLLKIAENKFPELAEDCEHRNGETCLEIDQACEFLNCPLKNEEVEEE